MYQHQWRKFPQLAERCIICAKPRYPENESLECSKPETLSLTCENGYGHVCGGGCCIFCGATYDYDNNVFAQPWRLPSPEERAAIAKEYGIR